MDLDPQPWGAIREVVDLYYGIKEGTVNANHAWWYPEIDTASHGFELVNINCTMDKYAQCWICGASQLRGVPVLVYPATPENSAAWQPGSVRPARQSGHHERKRSAPQGMVGERSAPGGFQGGAHVREHGGGRLPAERPKPRPALRRQACRGQRGRRRAGAYSKSK